MTEKLKSTPEREALYVAARAVFAKEHGPRTFVPGQTYVPPSGKVVDEADLLHLLDASLDMWLTAGRYARALEDALPASFGRTAKALLVNSGSSANLLAASTLGAPMMTDMGLRPLEPGDEVITVAAGFPTTVSPIVQNGWKPVFVDVDLRTLCPDVEAVKAARSPKTRAVMIAHPLGNPYRADLIAEWCAKENLYLIEDCCDAIGATIGGKPVGSFGHFATLSFYPAHHITMGEGGAVMAASGKLRRVAESVRDWGRDCWCEPGVDNTCKKRFGWQLGELPEGYDHKYTYSNLGYNLKVTDMQAAVGLSQLAKLPLFIEARRRNWRHLRAGIAASPLLSERLTPVEATPGTEPSWFGFPMHVAPGINRMKLTSMLEDKKVGTRLLFAGNLVRQPAFKNVDYRVAGELKNTDEAMARTFWVGLHAALGPAQLDYTLEQLEGCLKRL